MTILSSCTKKCNENLIDHSQLTEGDLSVNPYLGIEKLIFKSSNGDSIIFKNGLREYGKMIEYEYSAWQAEELGGCRGNYVYNDYDNTTFSSQKEGQKIMINLFNYYHFGVPPEGKQIQLAFDSKEENIGNFIAKFQFNNDSIFETKNEYDSIIVYLDTFDFESKRFLKVYELYAFNTEPKNIEWYCTAYYSIIDGFVCLKTNLGKFCYLNKKYVTNQWLKK